MLLLAPRAFQGPFWAQYGPKCLLVHLRKLHVPFCAAQVPHSAVQHQGTLKCLQVSFSSHSVLNTGEPLPFIVPQQPPRALGCGPWSSESIWHALNGSAHLPLLPRAPVGSGPCLALGQVGLSDGIKS